MCNCKGKSSSKKVKEKIKEHNSSIEQTLAKLKKYLNA